MVSDSPLTLQRLQVPRYYVITVSAEYKRDLQYFNIFLRSKRMQRGGERTEMAGGPIEKPFFSLSEDV